VHTTPRAHVAHTPGPWRLERDRSISAVGTDGQLMSIAEVYSGGPGIEQATANAELIGEAPQLLLALASIVFAARRIAPVALAPEIDEAEEVLARITAARSTGTHPAAMALMRAWRDRARLVARQECDA
jgi:hypothetical protein